MGPNFFYALACVVVPLAWGLLTVWVFGFVERKLKVGVKPAENPVAQDDQV